MPNPGLAVGCFIIAGVFLFMLIAAVQRNNWTLGSFVGIGWSGLTSIGFFTIAYGAFTGRQIPIIAGGSLALISLAAMFVIVIGFC
jgi:hypothetical protein